MPKLDIIRAWKDEEYRLNLTEAERALLPEHPAGLIQLDDNELRSVLGAGPHDTGIAGSSGCINRCTCPV
jgi:mersacidin/lichenicidin family type 2 lantibiotic